MATPYESARLLLQLYEQRREPVMRQARDFWFGFNPESIDEYMAAMFGPNGHSVRMASSYWEMATSLVVNGAIDPKMFADANGEHVIVYAKLEKILPAFREKMGNPNAFKNLETVVMSLPDARQRVDSTRERIKALAAKAGAAKA